MRLRLFTLFAALTIAVSPPALAQETEGPLQDPFLDDLVGTWTMRGQVMGDSVEYNANGKWVLDHQFLRLRMEDVSALPEYVAQIFIGYDHKAQEYVAHWLDSAGGRASKTLGYAQREENAVEFTFDYPDGPFRTTFEKETENRWHVHIRSKEDDGRWDTFAEYDMTPRSTP